MHASDLFVCESISDMHARKQKAFDAYPAFTDRSSTSIIVSQDEINFYFSQKIQSVLSFFVPEINDVKDHEQRYDADSPDDSMHIDVSDATIPSGLRFHGEIADLISFLHDHLAVDHTSKCVNAQWEVIKAFVRNSSVFQVDAKSTFFHQMSGFN